MNKIRFILIVWLLFAGVAFAQQQAPPYPTEFWLMGRLAADGKSGLAGYTVVFYNTATKPWQAYASAVTQADGNFLINAMADLSLLPLIKGGYYLGVGSKSVGGTIYGKNETNLEMSETDLAAGYKKGLVLTLVAGEGSWAPGTFQVLKAGDLPNGVVGQPYSTTLLATGGQPPYNWSLASGSLPAGLKLDQKSGLISGRPTGAGSFRFNLEAKDNSQPNQTINTSFTLIVDPPLGNGPLINLTALLQGFVNKPATVSLEARRAETPETATDVAGVCLIPLSALGQGTNRGSWEITPPAGAYYLVIKHQLASGDGNHMPIILKQKVNLNGTVNVNISEPASPDFKAAYTPEGKVAALITALRAGYLNNDKIIDISDYSVWKGAVTPDGKIDPNNHNSLRSDLNGDNIIDISDYALWKGTLQEFAPGGLPQTGDHVYVP